MSDGLPLAATPVRLDPDSGPFEDMCPIRGDISAARAITPLGTAQGTQLQLYIENLPCLPELCSSGTTAAAAISAATTAASSKE